MKNSKRKVQWQEVLIYEGKKQQFDKQLFANNALINIQEFDSSHFKYVTFSFIKDNWNIQQIKFNDFMRLLNENPKQLTQYLKIYSTYLNSMHLDKKDKIKYVDKQLSLIETKDYFRQVVILFLNKTIKILQSSYVRY